MSDQETVNDKALLFHLNLTGRILHMECIGGMKPLKPRAFCLVKTLSEIIPYNLNSIWLKNIKDVLANKNNYLYFCFLLNDTNYVTRMAYLRKGVVLAVVQFSD